jgi:hypothetical protein
MEGGHVEEKLKQKEKLKLKEKEKKNEANQVKD